MSNTSNLWSAEITLVGRIIYRAKNQHRSNKYYHTFCTSYRRCKEFLGLRKQLLTHSFATTKSSTDVVNYLKLCASINQCAAHAIGVIETCAKYMFGQVAATYFMPFSLACLGCLARFRALIMMDMHYLSEQMYPAARSALRANIVQLKVQGKTAQAAALSNEFDSFPSSLTLSLSSSSPAPDFTDLAPALSSNSATPTVSTNSSISLLSLSAVSLISAKTAGDDVLARMSAEQKEAIRIESLESGNIMIDVSVDDTGEEIGESDTELSQLQPPTTPIVRDRSRSLSPVSSQCSVPVRATVSNSSQASTREHLSLSPIGSSQSSPYNSSASESQPLSPLGSAHQMTGELNSPLLAKQDVVVPHSSKKHLDMGPDDSFEATKRRSLLASQETKLKRIPSLTPVGAVPSTSPSMSGSSLKLKPTVDTSRQPKKQEYNLSATVGSKRSAEQLDSPTALLTVSTTSGDHAFKKPKAQQPSPSSAKGKPDLVPLSTPPVQQTSGKPPQQQQGKKKQQSDSVPKAATSGAVTTKSDSGSAAEGKRTPSAFDRIAGHLAEQKGALKRASGGDFVESLFDKIETKPPPSKLAKVEAEPGATGGKTAKERRKEKRAAEMAQQPAKHIGKKK